MNQLNAIAENFKSILKDLNTAKEKLYHDLDTGASMTNLRNSLRKFQQSVKNKYAKNTLRYILKRCVLQ